jgi:hypothetical protein
VAVTFQRHRTGEKCHCDETRSTRFAEARRYNTNVEGSADDHEPTDIAAMLSDSDLSAENRRYVHNALACSMLEGWRPTRESVALLIDAVAGNITADEYRARVVASAATRGRQFGQLPTISVPDDFDDPLPDAEIVAWEGKPRD